MKTIIKLLVILLIFVAPSTMVSQGVTFETSGDGKIFFLGDEDRGIETGTLDVLFKSKWESNQGEYGLWHIGPTFEYAELPEVIYRRYTVEGGFTFNELIIENMFLTPYIDLGFIHRGKGKFSYGFGLTTGYQISDTFAITATNAFVLRSDFQMLYGTTPEVKWSVYIGFKFTLYNYANHSSTTSRF